MAYLLMVLYVCTGLAEGFFIKTYNRKYEQAKGGFIFTAIVSFCAALYFLCYDCIADQSGLSFPPTMLPYAAIAGLLYCTASVLTYYALKLGSFGLTMLILSYDLSFSVIYGLVFLHEPATAFTYIGLALMAISLFFFRAQEEETAEEEEGKKKKFSVAWLICISLSVVGSGMFSVVSRMQQIRFNNVVTNEFMAVALAVSTVILCVVGIVKDRKDCLYVFKKGSLYAFGGGLANGVRNMTKNIAYMLIPISIFAPTSTGIRIVITFLLSYLVFKEKLLKRQIIGVVLGTVAVILLNI